MTSIITGDDLQLSSLPALPPQFMSVLRDGDQTFSDFEIRPGQLVLSETTLGEGAFGTVLLGTLSKDGVKVQVAVKSLKSLTSERDLSNFLLEARLISSLSHPHLINLLGIRTKAAPFFILTEYMAHGNLRVRVTMTSLC
jgi:hypothetical protein